MRTFSKHQIQELAKESLGIGYTVMHGFNLDHLPEAILPDEQLIALVGGSVEDNVDAALLVLSTKRVFAFRHGIIRKHLQDFPLDKISSIQASHGFVKSKITIQTSGTSCTISGIYPKTRAESFVAATRDLIATEGRKPSALGNLTADNRAIENKAVSIQPSIPVSARLVELKQLFDAGLLEQEEYQDQRRRILSDL